MKSAENAEIRMKCAKIRENGRKWVKMGEISPKWGPKRRGHVWDCTKRIYIRFVQFPVIHGLVSEIMKFHEIS